MWVKLDDGFAQHPKVVGLGQNAFILHVAAMCYCGKYETDGWVPKSVLASLSPLVRNPAKAMAACIEQNVWEDHNLRIRIHDWDEYQPSREDRDAQRQRNRAKQERWRDRVSNRVTNGVSNGAPDPTRPDPNYNDNDRARGNASSSWDPEGIRAAWNAAVPGHMKAQVPPSKPPPQEADWAAVFAAVARNAFLCGEGRDVGPATLPWVLAHPDAVLEHATTLKPERKLRQL